MQEKSLKIIEQAPVGIITFSAEGEIDYINQSFRKFGILYRFETPSLIGSNVFNVDIFPHISIKEELRQLMQGFPFEKEINKITANDGRRIDLIVKGSPMYDNREIIGGILLIEDIKVLVETKADTELRSEYFERAIHHLNDVLIVTNSKGEVQFAEGVALINLIIIDKKIVGKKISELFEGEAKTLLSSNIDRVIANEESVKFEFEIEQGNRKFSFDCKIEPILNKRGTLQYCFLFFNNITVDVSEKNRLTKAVDELTYY